QRTVGIDPGADPHIEAWMERRETLNPPPDAPLFCTFKGGPMNPSQVRLLLSRLARRAGIQKRVHPHGYADLFVMPTSAGWDCGGGVIVVSGSA
ncbi:MAG: hypothetical protein U9N79_04500, partial [Actinomycetota bacterium]|nr:hypothetical protein [Actinomycetota bacterium]